MLVRIYLSFVGLMYMALSVWCSIDPATTSSKVGFDRVGGPGKSEFLVIYGGLELALALIFLMPWVQPQFTSASLWACIIVHACLVGFRMVSFMIYSDFTSMTYRLAIGEWVVLITALVLWWMTRGGSEAGA